MNAPAYIFSKKIDLHVFVFLPILLVGLCAIDNKASFLMGSLILWFDKIHIFYTYIKVDFKKDLQRDSRIKFKVFSLMVLSFLLLYSAFFVRGLTGVNLVIMYFAIFHFSRQQFGWIKIINKKLDLKPVDSRLSKIMAQVYCLGPIFIAHSKEYYFAWHPGVTNLFLIPDSFIKPILVVYLAILGLYFSYEVFSHLTGSIPFNLTRVATILFTAIGWNLVILLKSGGFFAAVLLIVGHHVFSYVFLAYFFNTEKRHQRKSLFFFYSAIILSVVLLMMTLRNTIPGYSTPLWLYSFTFSEIEQTIFYYFIPLLWVPSIFHFLLDGFIWKGVDLEIGSKSMKQRKNISSYAVY